MILCGHSFFFAFFFELTTLYLKLLKLWYYQYVGFCLICYSTNHGWYHMTVITRATRSIIIITSTTISLYYISVRKENKDINMSISKKKKKDTPFNFISCPDFLIVGSFGLEGLWYIHSFMSEWFSWFFFLVLACYITQPVLLWTLFKLFWDFLNGISLSIHQFNEIGNI